VTHYTLPFQKITFFHDLLGAENWPKIVRKESVDVIHARARAGAYRFFCQPLGRKYLL